VSYSYFIVAQDVEVNTVRFAPTSVTLMLRHIPTNISVDGVGKSRHKLKEKLMIRLDTKVRGEYCE